MNRFENVDCFSPNGIDSITEKIGCWIFDIPFDMTNNLWESSFPLKILREKVLAKSNNDTPMIFFTKQPFTTDVMNIFRDLFRIELIWVKEKGTNCFNANINPLPNHENILIFSKKRNLYNPNTDENSGKPYTKIKYKEKQGTNYNLDCIKSITTKNNGNRFPVTTIYFEPEYSPVIHIPRDNANVGLHSTQKPKKLIDWLLRHYSSENDIICDPTAGSGTTIVSCIDNKRSYICFEKDLYIYQLAMNRIREFQQSGLDRYKKPKKKSKNQLSLFQSLKK